MSGVQQSAGSFAIYRRMVVARVRSDAQYRLSFALRILSSSLLIVVDYVAVWALLRRVGSIGGWSLWPVTYVFGASSVAFRLADALVGGPVERSAELVRTGAFDTFFLRPMPIMLQLMGDAFALRRVTQFLAMVPFLVLGLVHLPITWTPLRALVLVLTLVNATIVFTSIFVVMCSLAFWSPNTTEIANAFTYGGVTIAQYPIHVMQPWIRALAFSIVPVGVAVYLPAFLLFDAPNPLGVRAWTSWLSLFACVPLAAIAAAVWRRALRHYRSTGS